MNTKETLNKVRTLLGIQVKFEQMKLDNGAVLEAEVFEAGAEIFVVADEERVAVPIGEYVAEDGKVIVVAEEGIIAEIKEAGAPEEEEAPAEVVEEEELAEEPVAPKKIVKSISEEMFFEEIKKLRDEFKLSQVEVKESVELSAEKVELEEVEAITHNPEKQSAKKEIVKLGKGKNKISSILNKVYN